MMRSKQLYIKKAIEASFLKLLEERPFEKITVKDIVEDCGLTRNTFYNYFEDTYDVVDGVLQQQMLELVRHCGQEDGTPTQAFLRVASLALAHPRAVNHLFRSPKRDELLRCVDKALELTVGHLIDGMIGDEPIGADDRKLIVDTYCFTAGGFLRRWIMNGMTESPEPMFDRLEALFGDTLREAIRVARKSSQSEN